MKPEYTLMGMSWWNPKKGCSAEEEDNEGALPCSQEPNTCSYPEPYKSSPTSPPPQSYFMKIPSAKSLVPFQLLMLFQSKNILLKLS